MALGYLFILLIALSVLALVIQYLLYSKGDETIFFINMIYGIVISYLNYTSQPTNFTQARMLSVLWGVLAVSAIILKSVNTKFKKISKIILTISLVGGLVQLIY